MPKKTPEEWVLIRADYESGDYTTKALCAKWEISQPSFDNHASKGGWISPHTGQPRGATAKQKAQTQEVPKGEVSAEMNKEQVDAALADIATSLLADPDDEMEKMKAELAEAKAELAALKPVTVEWAVDIDAAARMLQDELNDRVQMELNTINVDRLKRGLPHYTVADMDRDRKGWSESIRQTILEDTVSDLTKHASNRGPEKQKIDMLAPDGRVAQVPVELNIDGGQRPEFLRARGWKDIANQSCHRWNCYGVIPAGDPYNGFHSPLHQQLHIQWHPSMAPGVTTSGVFNG